MKDHIKSTPKEGNHSGILAKIGQLSVAIEERFVRMPELERLTGFKRSTLYRYIQLGKFPDPIKPTGGRASAWRFTEVQAWIQGSYTPATPKTAVILNLVRHSNGGAQ